MPVEAWRRAVSTTSISLADRKGLKKLSRQTFSACVKFGGNPCRDVETAWPKPVRTCPLYSDYVRSLRNTCFCTFECPYSSVLRPILLKLHTLTRLIESFPTVYGLWSCIEIEMSIPLGAHAKRPLIERASSTVTFSSYVLSCWKLHISTQLIDSFP